MPFLSRTQLRERNAVNNKKCDLLDLANKRIIIIWKAVDLQRMLGAEKSTKANRFKFSSDFGPFAEVGIHLQVWQCSGDKKNIILTCVEIRPNIVDLIGRMTNTSSLLGFKFWTTLTYQALSKTFKHWVSLYPFQFYVLMIYLNFHPTIYHFTIGPKSQTDGHSEWIRFWHDDLPLQHLQGILEKGVTKEVTVAG